MRAVTFLLILGVASAHGRRMQAWSRGAGHIWGSCGSHWTDQDGSHLEDADNVTSCNFVDNSTCSDHLSNGPSDADIEVVLGNLPPSTADQDVHVAWWGSFKSLRNYDPLSTPHGCSVYRDMDVAYPKYWEDGFNGGNVRVDENGTAVIRFREPSAYFIWPYLGVPHVHFRVCKGEASPQFYYDSLLIGVGELVVNTKSQDTPITIMSATEFPGGVSVEYEIPETDRWMHIPAPQTVPPPQKTATTTTATATTSATADMMEVIMDLTKDALILDALEFSPVYQCLLEETVFDHFSGACAEECPAISELRHGQCVLPAAAEAGASDAVLTASWQLEVRCESLCGQKMGNETLHNLRLSVAGHLDIPFQEVEQVAMTWLAPVGRRIAGQKRTAFLFVQVATQRHEKASGERLLGAFLRSTGEASQLLGLRVEEVVALPKDVTVMNGDTWLITSGSDPYAVAYEALVSDDAGDDVGKSTESGSWLSPGCIAGVVAAAVVVGICSGALLWALRRQVRHRQQAVEARIVEGKVLEIDESVAWELGVSSSPKIAWTTDNKVVP